MISTGATIEGAVGALLAHGCRREVVVVATHALFVGRAADRLSRPEVVRVLASDSLPPSARDPERLEIVRLAPLLAETIRRIVGERGLDDLLAAR
jgi:ribose-phosphate pyrophosphokinase